MHGKSSVPRRGSLGLIENRRDEDWGIADMQDAVDGQAISHNLFDLSAFWKAGSTLGGPKVPSRGPRPSTPESTKCLSIWNSWSPLLAWTR